ncbi:hypothetical protein NCC49_001956 [Naganishia albida]|nr:hypothetical protein NCC49_001956 [Naganishia albida]
MCHILRPGYKTPKRRKIANEYLDGAYLRLRDQAHELLNGATARTRPLRFTLVSDGWTHIGDESIVNHVLVSPKGQALFHSSDPTGANSHTGDYLASELMRAIKSVGAKKIIAICTDTDSNMLSAVGSVVAADRHIHPIRCTSHQLNLVVKDLLEVGYIKEALSWVVDVARWFKSHAIPLNLLKEEMKRLYDSKSRTPMLPVSTLWQSKLDCIKSVLDFEKTYRSVILIPAIGEALSKKGAGGARTSGNLVIEHITTPAF